MGQKQINASTNQQINIVNNTFIDKLVYTLKKKCIFAFAKTACIVALWHRLPMIFEDG